MKKNIRYIILAVVVVLSGFILSTKSTDPSAEIAVSTSLVKKEKPVIVERYSEKQSEKVKKELDFVLQRINKFNDFHGSILVAKNGKILYDNQIGYADFSKKEPLNDESIFQLASVSKQFTAAGIMLLYERNQLKLTDLVNSYFPNFPYENVTIKNLLNHTAGLPKYFYVAENFWKESKAPSNSEVLELLESCKVQRNFKAGNGFEYSNTGYLVLASIIEKVSGHSFGDFMKKNIFDPLGMNDSFVYNLGENNVNNNQLDGFRVYRGGRHVRVASTVNDAVVGDKNIYATGEDLYKWLIGLNNGKLLSKKSVELMYSKGETASGRKIPYGFGFRIDNREDNIIYHHGKWNGFSTSLTQYPDEDLVIIILEHTSYSGMTALNKKIKDIVAQNFKS